MKLDPKTIILLTIVGSLLMSGGLFAVARGYLGQVSGVARWARATLVQALGWLIVGALRGVIPDLLSICLGQGLILLSLVMYLHILADFNQHHISRRWPYALVLFEVLCLYYFAAVTPSLNVRLIIISFCRVPLMFASVYVLTLAPDGKPQEHIASQRFMAGLYIFGGTAMVLRGLYCLVFFPDQDRVAFAQNTMNDLSYVVFYIFSTLLSFGFVLMCNDRYIEQQKRADDALQTNNALFAKLTAQVPGMIYQYQLFADGRSCFPFVSKGIRQIYELTPEEVKHDASAVFDRIHADDRQMIIDAVNNSAQNMRPCSLEYRVVLPQQGLCWRHSQSQPEQQPDGSILWHGFITDTTEQAQAKATQRQLEQEVLTSYEALKLSESRLRRLMNSSLVGILQGDAAGRLREANEVMLHLVGHQRSSLENGSLNWFDLIPPDQHAQQRAAFASLRSSTPQFESELIAQDGSVIPIMLGLAQLEGSANEWVGFVLDLREQRRIDQLKAEFISVVSHELRTPLTSIRGSLGLLEGGLGGDMPAAAMQLIKIAHKNSQRLGSLVNEILDMEKLASSKMSLNMAAVDLLQMAQQAIDANAGYAQNFQVHYVLQADAAPCIVQADTDRLMQIFANLLSNAAKFSPHGAVVQLRVQRHGTHARVEVEDHGCGIPLAFREHIFGKFAQADATTTRHVEGAGLGLHITKTLVEKMYGEIGFTSEEGQGTVFWFSLPLHETIQD